MLLKAKPKAAACMLAAVFLACVIACLWGFSSVQKVQADEGSGASENVAIYQLYDTGSRTWFWTADAAERNQKKADGWLDEGIAWYAPSSGNPVYLYHYQSGSPAEDHQACRYGPPYFTRSIDGGTLYDDETMMYFKNAEKQGVAWYCSQSQGVPLYWLTENDSGRQYITSSKDERDTLLKRGWVCSNSACYVAAVGSGETHVALDETKIASVEVADSSFIYDGREKRIDISNVNVRNVLGQVISTYHPYAETDNEDFLYTLTYSNNVNAGQATLCATSVFDTSNKAETSFAIQPRPIDGATIVVSDRVYTGGAVEPEPTVTLDGKTLTAGSDYTVSYSDNVQPGNATVTVTGMGNYTGAANKNFDISVASIPQYRLYNPNSGEHFYTSAVSEKDELIGLGWRYEEIGWTAPATSGTPVFRMYNPVAGEHHYTPDQAERDMLIDAGWHYEGIGWYSDDAKSVPLYRDYNPNAFANNHNYTADKTEHDYLVSIGWDDEGFAWYGI